MKNKGKPSLDLRPIICNDIIVPGCNDRIKKGTMSEKRKNIKFGKRRTATLRKDGRWQVYILLGVDRKACYGRTEYKANYKADIEEAIYKGDEETLRMLTGDEGYQFCNCFYRYRNYMLFYTNRTQETVDRYEQTFNKYFEKSIFGVMDIRTIDNVDVSNFLSNIFKKYEKLTDREWQRIRHIIKATISFIYDEELNDILPEDIPSINWDKIKEKALEQGKILKPIKKQYAVTTPEKQILHDKIIDENVYPEKYTHVLLLLINFSLGLRIGELAALKVDDIDMVHHVVYVADSCKSYKERDEYGNAIGGYIHTEGVTKTPNGKRIIPMSHNAQKLFEILLQYRKDKGYTSKFLSYDEDDAKARTKAMSRTLRKLCEKTDIEDFTSHIIRKTFASSLSQCPDIDIATISEYLGHAQVSTTVNNYLIPARDTIEDRIEKISRFI